MALDTRNLLICQEFCQHLLSLSLINAMLVCNIALRVYHLLIEPLLSIFVKVLGKLFQLWVVWLLHGSTVLLLVLRLCHILHARARLATRVAGVA